MTQDNKSEKIVMSAIQVNWRLYYLILVSRVIAILWFLIVFYLELKKYGSPTLWVFLTFLIIVVLVLAIIIRPYWKIGNLVISDTRIYFEGKYTDISECDKLELCLSKSLNSSMLAGFFSFYQYGFGSWIRASSNGRVLIKVNFLLEKKKELQAIVDKLNKIEVNNNLTLEVLPFNQPKFPRWKDFKRE